jgi:hypothetical protein
VSLKVPRHTWKSEINFLFPERHHLMKGVSVSLPVLEVYTYNPGRDEQIVTSPNDNSMLS